MRDGIRVASYKGNVFVAARLAQHVNDLEPECRSYGGKVDSPVSLHR